VTNQYAALTQREVDALVNRMVSEARVDDALSGAAIGLVVSGLGAGPIVSTGFALFAGLNGASGLDYVPHVGDRIKTTVTAAYGSGASSTRTVVTRADGNTLNLNRAIWRPR
jgi:hypothetical protein